MATIRSRRLFGRTSLVRRHPKGAEMSIFSRQDSLSSRGRGLPAGRRLRRATVAVAAASALASLSACGGGSADSGKVTLTMWQQWGGGHEREVLDKLIADYEKTHPNVTIKETPVTNNAKILASITGGNPPDIVDLGNSLPLGAWASAGALTQLDSYIQSAHLDTSQYVQNAFRALRVNGKTYGLPFQIFNAGLIYNKKLFAQAGLNPPSTLEELASDARKLTKVDASGAITQMGFLPNYPGPDQGQTCPLISYAYAFGGQWFDGSRNPTPNAPGNVAALNWEKSFYNGVGVQKAQNFIQSAGSYLTGGDPLESGKVAMMFDGPWSIQFAKDNAPAVAADLGVVPLPASSTAPSASGSTYIDANAQVIPSGAKHAQAAFDFIAWETTNAKETATFSDTVANIPQLAEVPNFPLLQDPKFKEYVTIAHGQGAKSWVQTASSSTYGTNICQAQDAALLNGTDPAAALRAVKTK
jgi:multiple sugar transport system substrate-binding protein